ncbi:hypothetical protein [Acinetobacter sp. F9]|uniref:hypothetical protein n=1 Tax=Acinetobacter sp. F9 TaxID=2853158 RepID=UPI001C45F67C|nr:hypothetical protein [Acinetobacter sp. F9]
MACFIYVYDKRNNGIPSNGSFKNFLPLNVEDAKKISLQISNNEKMYYWSWGDVFDRNPKQYENGFSVFDGISFELNQIDSVLSTQNDFNGLDEKISAGCSFLKVLKDKVFSFVSLPGTHSLFYLNNEKYFIVSTHLGLISSFNKLTLRKAAIKWLCGRYHMADFGTLYDETEQVPLGYTVTYDKNEDKLSFIKPNLGSLFNNFSFDKLNQEIEKYVYKQKQILDGFNSKFKMTLSGGKDSRAIISLFYKCELSNKIEKVVTTGYFSSPEVMSAKKVLQKLGVVDKHVVEMPKSVHAQYNFPNRIVKTLFARQGEGGLSDLAQISKNKENTLYIGGHENGLKTPANKLPLEKYLDSRKWWVDGANIFKENNKKLQLSYHLENFKKYLGDVPLKYYPHLEALFFRNGTYVAGALKASNVGANQYHPFLNREFMKIMLSSDDDSKNVQWILYKLTQMSEKELELVGFCNDAWPVKLKDFLIQNNLDNSLLLKAEDKYKFYDFLPDATGFGVYKWRQDMCIKFIPFIRDKFYQYSDTYFDFIDKSKLERLLSKDVYKMNVMELGGVLSVLTSIIHIEYGVDIFDKSKHSYIQNKLSEVMDCELTSTNDKSSLDPNILYLNKIQEFDKALENAVNLIRETTDNTYYFYGGSTYLSDKFEIYSNLFYELDLKIEVDEKINMDKAFILEFLGDNVFDLVQFPIGNNGNRFKYVPSDEKGVAYVNFLLKSKSNGICLFKISKWNIKKSFIVKDFEFRIKKKV